ncbi:maleylpyruvate isomerase N-terminal domain-containing protein [Nakamurella sp. PAMC28650]|uniref:maleylpyruvate isomerase N-terminal domain-containing protein n=1 Tax=Nakamurella sp. PAMC28650 TaxID=2762325 RepID=UPI00164DB95A|nr:maleylpyruvate isomerase N-terminal domain-containing protein [Nakamurella sp. PAMC28650]QNK82896.1 maleylpyruvate isomerase N-terminal domain-containing protein [Nakamurella sp. PAMC28650]
MSASPAPSAPAAGADAGEVVAAMRSHHDRLAALVDRLDEAALTGPSGAAKWRVCDVLSHLGSGAEIMLPAVAAAVAGVAPAELSPPPLSNQSVWDRWNASTPRAQAIGFVQYDATLVQLLEGLDAAQRDALRVGLGRRRRVLPEPVPLVVAAGMRLNEVVLHTWDVEVGLDPAAVVDDDLAALLLRLLAGPLGFLLSVTSHPEALTNPVALALPVGAVLVVDDAVSLTTAAAGAPQVTATLTGSPEAAARLLTGRLGPDHTPSGVDVEGGGTVTLDDLRRVFPGF